jgi:catechol 2,3-dioxygenase-like lactoylglutathione lyase family enzyme
VIPRLHNVVIDTTDARRLAEFYRELLGYAYQPGDEPPPPGAPDPKGQDWLVLASPSGGPRLGFQQVDALPPSTWPANDVPQQLHFDFSVGTPGALTAQRDRALALGARVVMDRFNDPHEPLYVFADPDGHPFCIFVSPES